MAGITGEQGLVTLKARSPRSSIDQRPFHRHRVTIALAANINNQIHIRSLLQGRLTRAISDVFWRSFSGAIDFLPFKQVRKMRLIFISTFSILKCHFFICTAIFFCLPPWKKWWYIFLKGRQGRFDFVFGAILF